MTRLTVSFRSSYKQKDGEGNQEEKSPIISRREAAVRRFSCALFCFVFHQTSPSNKFVRTGARTNNISAAQVSSPSLGLFATPYTQLVLFSFYLNAIFLNLD